MFKTEKKNLQLIIGDRKVKRFLLCSIYCHLRGQTFRAVTGIEIQTDSKFKMSSLPCFLLFATIQLSDSVRDGN